MPSSDHPKPVITNTPKAPPQKKMENLEVLKEELRKKQEMLDQKRNDFRRKLDELQKQATSSKVDVESEQVAKRQKLGTVVVSRKAATSSSCDPEINLSSPKFEVICNGSKSLGRAVPSMCPLFHQLSPIVSNWTIVPTDLAKVAVFKEHFSPFGDISKVELDDQEPADCDNDPGTAKYSARVYFTTRHAAEKAFTSGKCWNGHNLQFVWLKYNNRESPLPASKGNSDVSVGPIVEVPKTDSQKPATSGDERSKKIKQKDIIKDLLPCKENA